MKRVNPRGERGQSAAELALIVPILITILYVMVQFGQVYLQYQEVTAATSEGARRASTMAGVADPGRTSTIVATVGGQVHRSARSSVRFQRTPGHRQQHVDTGKSDHGQVHLPASVSILGVTLFSGSLTTARTTRVLN